MSDLKERLDIRISSSLKYKIKEYAKRHGTTVTGIIVEYFRRLLEREGEDADVEQV